MSFWLFVEKRDEDNTIASQETAALAEQAANDAGRYALFDFARLNLFALFVVSISSQRPHVCL